MKTNKNAFGKNNIINRFIAVKYSKIPSSNDNCFIIKPLSDGLGFINKIEGFQKIGASHNDEQFIKNEVKNINQIISYQYTLFKRKEMSKHISRQFNDKIIICSFILNLLFFFFIQKSLYDETELFFYIGFGGYLLILLLVVFLLCSSLFVKRKSNKNFSKVLPVFVDPIIKKMVQIRNFRRLFLDQNSKSIIKNYNNMKDNSILRTKTLDKNIIVAEKLQKIQIPKSTDNRLIVPCNPNGYGFVILNENKEYLKNLTTQKMNKTIRNFNKIIDQIIIKKKLSETKDYNKQTIMINNYIMAVSIFVAIIMFLLSYNDVKDFNDTYIWIPIVFIIVCVVAVLIVLIRGIFIKPETIEVDQMILQNLNVQSEVENQKVYNPTGYRISVGQEFCWLEFGKNVQRDQNQ